MKPLCELCSTRHDGHQGHVFATNKNKNLAAADKSATNEVDNAPRVDNASWITPAVIQPTTTYKYRDAEKRREQMREVMKRRRARLKSAATA